MTFLMISKKLNEDSDLLGKNIESIVDFIKNNTKENEPILMGNILTGKFRNKLIEYGFKFKVQSQATKSLKNHNKKLIRENDPVLFIHVDNSKMIREFIDYANEQKNKTIKILDIKSKVINQNNTLNKNPGVIELGILDIAGWEIKQFKRNNKIKGGDPFITKRISLEATSVRTTMGLTNAWFSNRINYRNTKRKQQ